MDLGMVNMCVTVDYNQLTTLPKSIDNLTKLSFIRLTDNELRLSPFQVGFLHNVCTRLQNRHLIEGLSRWNMYRVLRVLNLVVTNSNFLVTENTIQDLVENQLCYQNTHLAVSVTNFITYVLNGLGKRKLDL